MVKIPVKISTNVEELQKLLDEAKTCVRQLEKSLEAINNFDLEAKMESVNKKVSK